MERQLKRITGLFLIVAAIIVGSVVVTYWSGQIVISNSRTLIGRLEADNELQSFYNILLEAESGQRGFLLTGEDKYLARYHTSVEQIGNELDNIDELAKEGRIPGGIAGEIHTLTQRKLAEMELTIDLWRKQGPEPALNVVRTGEGVVLMGKIYRLIHENEVAQQARAHEERSRAERNTSLRNVVFTAVGLINLLFLGWMYRRVSQEMELREKARAAEREHRELLSVTLQSIGDAVIVTDTLGLVTFMNQVAQDLTGRTEAESLGKPIAEVFHIVNEETRHETESPVQKVLREGVVVGLANHTLLVKPDGTMTPIDDSGAPVRDRFGRIHGVVLVFRDFSEHKKHEQELQDAKQSAERASQAKDQFMAALSHELRTPLTPVLAMLTNWESGDELPAKHRVDLQMMRRNVELEARLIDDLLDLTRVVKGKLTINVERADIHDILQHVQQTCRSEANAKHISVEMHLGAEKHHVMADPARLQQIFWNILRNATKFSRKDGRVVVSTADTDGMVEISIRDEGIGMDKETLERVFRPFEQGGPAITRQYGGLGLGLAISKALVDIQGGTLEAQSEGPGKGSEFTVKLRYTEEERTQRRMPAIDGVAGAPIAKSLRILLVEDHVDTARTMERLLTNLGHKVTTAGTVADALEAVKRQSPELILSDIGLPDGNGVQLLGRIREFSQAPAIALTGFGMDEDISRTRAAGFRAHLTKPVNFQRLESIVRQLATNAAWDAGEME